jgi:predicted P-loop ATPase
VDKYYSQVVAICKERNMYQPLSTYLKAMEKQCQDVDVVRFLLDLNPECECLCADFGWFGAPISS